MFGNNKKKDSPQKKNTMPSNSNAINSLVAGTEVEGTIKSENDIRVDGTIKGTLNCDAKVIIGPHGYIDGTITCVNALIEGKFVGDLTVEGLLHIKENADITGDIRTSKLVVEPGAIFNVSCNMSNTSSNGSVRSSAEAEKIAQTQS